MARSLGPSLDLRFDGRLPFYKSPSFGANNLVLPKKFMEFENVSYKHFGGRAACPTVSA